jgi:hypothetical protein
VIGGVKPLEPDQYEYDKLWIDSEAGLYHVDIAINWDLLGSAAENINQNFSLKVYPNPANHHVTFSLTGYESAEAELEIHDITGRAVIVIPVISGLSASWNLTGKDGARVKPGHYVFRLVSNQRVHTGRIVITE